MTVALGFGATAHALEVTAQGGGGLARIDDALWLTADAGLTLRRGPWQMTLRAPMRTSATQPGALRRRDWDDRSELMRLLPRLAWRPPVEPGRLARFSVEIAPTAGATLGHGSLIRGYRSALLPDQFKSGLVLNVDAGGLGVQFIADDVTRFTVVGVRLFARPWSRRRGKARRRGLWRNLTVGISAVADRDAPLRAQTTVAGALRVDQAGRARMSRGTLVLAGVDLGLPIALGRNQDLVPYVDVNVASISADSSGAASNAAASGAAASGAAGATGEDGGGAGLHAGLWWAWRGRAAHVRLRWEARRSEGSYRPGWIDGFYALERRQAAPASPAAAAGGPGQPVATAGGTAQPASGKAGVWLDRGGGGRWGQLLQARATTPSGWLVAATWETWIRSEGDRPDDTASLRIQAPVWRGVRAQAAWALRPGEGQQSAAASVRWQSDGPWHAWWTLQRTWHASAGVYRLRINSAGGVGARWRW